jgi:hypothetical protein
VTQGDICDDTTTPCIDGYYYDSTSADVMKCVKCAANCVRCSDTACL